MPAPRVTSTRVVYKNRWMRLHEDRLDPPGLYAWVEKSPGAVIVPLDDDGVWLVEQYRHPVRLRYRSRPLACDARIEDGALRLRLGEPVDGAAPGQVACLLRGDAVVGHGIIAG